MNQLTRIATVALPASIGMGIAWVGISLMRNEGRLQERKVELELQLGAKSLKGI